MGGICGFTGFIDNELLHRMTDTLFHRGPDAEGYYITEQISLGVRRLAVVDLQTGDQPIYNEDKSVVVVFNGEIYNFKELRQDLELKGHKFYTKTDTEVILHLYEDYGENFLVHLCGMFAIALWDNKRKQL
ncbi:MAG: asparagine synthetase B, partial [Elusimicrobiota bacterium]|nr:asparagine synthetase B [Elusimicrobiota bacterium]